MNIQRNKMAKRKKIVQTDLDRNIKEMNTFVNQSFNLYSILIKSFKDGVIDLNIYNEVIKYLDQNNDDLLTTLKKQIDG